METLSSRAYTARSRPRAVVIGGGVLGLASARELHRDGWSVTVLERGEPGREASSAAAGMLAPRLEYRPGDALLEIGKLSQSLYPDFARELEEETGLSVDLRWNGFVVPASGDDPPGSPVEGARRIRGDELREIEPTLSPAIAEAFFYAGEGSVDNRALVRALLASMHARDIPILTHSPAEAVLVSGGRARGAQLRGGRIESDVVVNCAGAWADQIRVPGAQLRTRPIKGQMLSLDASGLEGGAPRRTIYSHDAYIVPRSDGRVIVGTTVEDCGFDKTVEADAIERLRRAALQLCPALASAPVSETWAGLRPLGDGAAPRVEPLGPEGYFVAVGHYRNGILLAPWTARLLADLVAGKQTAHAPISPG